MTTNLEKYRSYEKYIDAIRNEFCASVFPDGLPKSVFTVGINFIKYKNGYHIKEWSVEGVQYNIRKPFFNKRPSKEVVAAIKKMSDEICLSKMDEAKVFLKLRSGNTTTAIRFDLFGSNASISADDLISERDRMIKKFVAGENQFKCSQCGQATDDDKKVVREVIARQYPNMRKSFDYCSGRCANHHQMAHEG